MYEKLYERQDELYARLDNLESCEDNLVYADVITAIHAELADINLTLQTEFFRRSIDMVLTDRSHKAVAINLDGRKVLTFDLDIHESGHSSYEAGSKAVIIHHSKNPRYDGTRERCYLGYGYQTADDGEFYLSKESVCISASEWWSVYMEFATFANAPALEPGDRCAILCYSKRRNYTEVHTVVFEKTMRFSEQSKEDTMPSIVHILRN